MKLAERYGPWAVVLGASEGTGREFARQLAAGGVPSVLVARREAPLAKLAEEIRAESAVECVTATVDLAATDALDRIAAAVGDREVGLLVVNAGGDPNGALFLDRDLRTWETLIQRNVMTTLAAARRFLEPMRARGRGGILLVNSGACYGGVATLGPYCGSKAFMLCLAEALWAEMKPHGVDVLTLVLGMTDTPEFRRFMAEKGQPFPENAADAGEVARAGLERLPHGPIHNIGERDDERGMTQLSAAERRQRVEAASAGTMRLYGRSRAR